MSRKAYWSGNRLVDLLTLPLDELEQKYKQFNRNHLLATKRYWSRKVEKMPEEQKPEEFKQLSDAFREAGINFTPEELSQAERAGFHVGYIKNSEGEIEYTKPLPHVDFGKRKGINIEPVTPALIRYTSARIPKRDHKIIFVFSDSQIGYRRIDEQLYPIHDERAISAALKLANDLRPNYVVDCGDSVDLAELGRWQAKDNHFAGTLQMSLQRDHDMHAEFTAATPKAERHIVDSNHAKRLGDYILRGAPELFAVRAAGAKYPAFSYPALMQLDQIDWEFHGGYGTAEYEYAEDLAFIHGIDSVSGGSTAAKLSRKNYDRNIVQGHAHRMESQYRTDRHGRIFGAFVVGALCRTDGIVPSYYSAVDQFNKPVKYHENWQNGVMVIRDYGDGQYQFDQVPIINGTINYNGRRYNGEE